MTVPEEWRTAPLPTPQPLAGPVPAPAAPGCTAVGCTATPLVQWQRRHPTDPGSTVAVFGCGPHAIGMDLATLVHAPDCGAPDPALLPQCGCTPEPAPPPEPMQVVAQPLPDHWT